MASRNFSWLEGKVARLDNAILNRHFYITTPIYYPNGEPHLGTVYTTIAADAIARRHRLAGEKTFFLTGTDEHGIKMVKTAAAEGIEPQALVDRNVAVFESLWKELEISNDDFIRTTSQRHKAATQEIVRKLVSTGDIYLGSYSGWYDEGQEEFVTETDAKASEYKSPISGRPLTRYSEPSYFFRLGKYAPRVLDHIERHEDFIRPQSRRNEIISKLKLGVEDLSISRQSLTWGIPLPNDPSHVLYVWIDALSNYITALGYGSSDPTLFNEFWPADVHLIGKDILWFHTVYWPAILMALNLPLPRTVMAHGWWTSGGRKMSKSLGNFVELAKIRQMAADHSLDAVRYYLLRAGPFGADLDFNDADFAKAFSELADVLGNCLNRVVKMTGRYRGGILPAEGEKIDHQLPGQTAALAAQVADAWDKLELHHCATLPIELARATNGFFDATTPWKLGKDPAQAGKLDTVLNWSAQAVYQALLALLPILPAKAAQGLRQLGVDVTGKNVANLPPVLSAGTRFGEGNPLFPKIQGQ
ncbi:MAG TPA: methionine--tRNA ligase [Tepidisphaeraceae bacterium]|nr:methionine--tRNA ligase [Tepidisphaeraceae bacterium]